MKILNILRYLGWMTLEKIKSDSVAQRMKEIERVMHDDEYYQTYKELNLRNLLVYATHHCAFYRSRCTTENYSLKDFPVIDKNEIMKNPSAFQSDAYDHSCLHVMSTSGSTGRPFKITQNPEKRRQVLAEILYFSGLLGYKPGKKFVYLRNLESGFSKSKLKTFLQNEEVILTRKYDDEHLRLIVNQLKSLENNTTILGYASTLQAIASYMRDHQQLLNNVTGIISGAEAITTKTRRLVSQQFSCPVVSRYSNQEMGILAQDSEEDIFELNRASYCFELLSTDSDEPVQIGEMGRIVVTDLFNLATPLIRYDTGDMGVMKVAENGRPYLAKVYGRKLDLLYTTKNEPVTFFALDDFFENNYDIEQYQIIQNERDHITLNFIMKKGKSVDESWCQRQVQSVLGEDCKVDIHYLDSVPITASGKFKYVICNYKPNF